MIYDMKARRLEQSTLHALRAQQRDGSGTERLGELPLPEETQESAARFHAVFLLGVAVGIAATLIIEVWGQLL